MDNLAASSEFANAHVGESRAQIVTDLFRQVLGREPDADGLKFYTNNGTIGEVLSGIVLGNESVSHNQNGLQRFETLAYNRTTGSTN